MISSNAVFCDFLHQRRKSPKNAAKNQWFLDFLFSNGAWRKIVVSGIVLSSNSLCAPLRALPAQSTEVFPLPIFIWKVSWRSRSKRHYAALCTPGGEIQRRGPRPPSLCRLNKRGYIRGKRHRNLFPLIRVFGYFLHAKKVADKTN